MRSTCVSIMRRQQYLERPVYKTYIDSRAHITGTDRVVCQTLMTTTFSRVLSVRVCACAGAALAAAPALIKHHFFISLSLMSSLHVVHFSHERNYVRRASSASPSE